jgi:cytochrome c oxidase subunit III
LSNRTSEVVVAHHFETAEQQKDSALMGMWLFLAQEVMFFGGLFTAYAVYRFKYPDAWHLGSAQLDKLLGAGNTVVLLVSSLTMAMAVYSAQVNKVRQLFWYLVATGALGTLFLVVKYFEYASKFTHGIVPRFAWAPGHLHVPDGLGPVEDAHLQLFFILYFTMTGMHAFHMVVGIGFLGVLLVMTKRQAFGSHRYMPIELFGFYWHFVDIVWVFLFPLLYLIG